MDKLASLNLLDWIWDSLLALKCMSACTREVGVPLDLDIHDYCCRLQEEIIRLLLFCQKILLPKCLGTCQEKFAAAHRSKPVTFLVIQNHVHSYFIHAHERC